MSKQPDSAYVAGPMSNRPYFNFPQFDAVAAAARKCGRWDIVFNPHEHDQETYAGIDEAHATLIGDVQAIAVEVGFSFAEAMQWDLSKVIRCSSIILLPEWETSTGGKIERMVAEATGSEVWLAEQTHVTFPSTEHWDFRLDDVQKRLAVGVASL